jgi:hypothetical protein
MNPPSLFKKQSLTILFLAPRSCGAVWLSVVLVLVLVEYYYVLLGAQSTPKGTDSYGQVLAFELTRVLAGP